MFKFYPIFKSVLWGGNRLADFKRIQATGSQIGESWEISGIAGNESVVAGGCDDGLTLSQLINKYRGGLVGERVYARYGNNFPLLIKFIDAASDLSVQVHPDDDLAAARHGSMGKTEMWYVIDAQPKSLIHAGFSRTVTPDEFKLMIADGSIMQAMHHFESHSGDAFFLPAGVLHSIGAGNLIAEIQQSSDVTYRVYDYDRCDANGNKRQLHIDLALDAIDFERTESCAVDYQRNEELQLANVVSCQQFVVGRINTAGGLELPVDNVQSFYILMCIGGAATITSQGNEVGASSMTVSQGETVLVSACASRLEIKGQAAFLTAHLP